MVILIIYTFHITTKKENLVTQQTKTRDFTCSVSEFTSSTGSIHVNSPDYVNKFGEFFT